MGYIQSFFFLIADYRLNCFKSIKKPDLSMFKLYYILSFNNRRETGLQFIGLGQFFFNFILFLNFT